MNKNTVANAEAKQNFPRNAKIVAMSFAFADNDVRIVNDINSVDLHSKYVFEYQLIFGLIFISLLYFCRFSLKILIET